LASGDENTKQIQACAKGRKDSNTIWSLRETNGREVYYFEGLASLGRNHFQELFREDNKVNIVGVVRMA